jgi:hypothetical protein
MVNIGVYLNQLLENCDSPPLRKHSTTLVNLFQLFEYSPITPHNDLQAQKAMSSDLHILDVQIEDLEG